MQAAQSDFQHHQDPAAEVEGNRNTVDILVDTSATISSDKSTEQVCELTSWYTKTVGVAGVTCGSRRCLCFHSLLLEGFQLI